MSAQYIVTFNGRGVKFLEPSTGQLTHRRVFELVKDDQATPFSSEVHGWQKVGETPGLKPLGLVEVKARS